MRYQEIFEAEELQDELQLFANQTESELSLQVFSLYMLRGDIKLISLIINKEDRKKGLGSEAMERLTKFADNHGKRIVLSPASKDDYHGTTSRSRLIKFYKRFGFYENKGKDFSISETMIRDPQLMERLNEKVEKVGGITVLINPTIPVLQKFIKETVFEEVRVLFDNKNFYFWDGGSIIHDRMAQELGIEWYTRLIVSYRSMRTLERFRVELLDSTSTHKEILKHPYYKKLVDLDYRKIASVLESLNEKVEMVDDSKVLVNPSVNVLRRFIFGSAYGTVRGLFDGKKFYFWDADKIIHDHMAMELGLSFYSRLDLWRNKDGSFNIDSISGIVFDGMERMIPEVLEHPYYLKLQREG